MKRSEKMARKLQSMLKKEQVAKTEEDIRMLMRMDSSIWDKHGWKHGGMVVDEIYKKELKEKLDEKGIQKLPDYYYHILEDANFHTLTSVLEDLKMFSPNWKYEKGEADYKKYKKLGGRTWNVFD